MVVIRGYRVHLYQILFTWVAQDPRHLQYVADVNESNVYMVTQGRKLYGMPTDFGFCIKVKTLACLGGNGSCLVPRILPKCSELHLGHPDSSLHCALPSGDWETDIWS